MKERFNVREMSNVLSTFEYVLITTLHLQMTGLIWIYFIYVFISKMGKCLNRTLTTLHDDKPRKS